jgi:hypothetical protein
MQGQRHETTEDATADLANVVAELRALVEALDQRTASLEAVRRRQLADRRRPR